MAGKYTRLAHYLHDAASSGSEVTLRFEQIERIVQGKLPPSAYQSGPWWGDSAHAQIEAIAWMDECWMIGTVDLKEKWVKFVRQ